MLSDFWREFLLALKLETQGIRIFDNLFLLLIQAIVIMGVGRVFKKKGWISFKKLVYLFWVLVYTEILLSITIFRRMPGSREGIVHLGIYLGFGFLSGQPSSWVSALSVMNIFLFIPLGILAYPIFRHRNRITGIGATTLISFFTSLMIESTQYVTGRGMFEISDLVTNTVGGLIGAVIADLLYHVIQKVLDDYQKYKSSMREVI
jgi:glycopeptide antibiotics resistance protein